MDECLICFQNKSQNANLFSLLWDDDLLCYRCRSKLTVINKNLDIGGLKCHVIYRYDHEFSALLLQYKELFDEALYPVFLSPYRYYLHLRYHNYAIVLVPSTLSKQKERGFNHLMKIFESLNLEIIDPFEKKEGMDQKQTSYKNRQRISERISLKENVKLPDKPLLLVDDVITTGASIHACYHLLNHHPYPIRLLSISATPTWLERK